MMPILKLLASENLDLRVCFYQTDKRIEPIDKKDK